MKILILDEAKLDIAKGIIFYELQKNGLGQYFLDTISSDIESLHIYCGIHIKVKNYHKLISKRFPYAIYYKYDDTKWSMDAVSEGEDNDGEPCEGGSDIWEISNNGQITGSITSGTVDNNNNVFFENRECQGSLNENGNGSGRCSSADGCIAEWTATLIEGTIG